MVIPTWLTRLKIAISQPITCFMRIGVVGCGYVAEYHMPFIVKQKNVDRVIVTDFDPQKAERLQSAMELKRCQILKRCCGVER